jgi:hypothetical protein
MQVWLIDKKGNTIKKFENHEGLYHLAQRNRGDVFSHTSQEFTVRRYFQIEEVMQKTPNEVYFRVTEIKTAYP